MNKKDENFLNSQNAFNELWDKARPSNGAMIAYINAVVPYQTDVVDMNKTVLISGITLDNSDNHNGGRINFPTDDFNENIYHGSFIARYQNFSFNGSNFKINELGINQYFSHIFVVESNSETPALKAKYLSEIGADVFVGDTESDYKAALIAKCEFKAMVWGFRSKKYWDKKNIDNYNDFSYLKSY